MANSFTPQTQYLGDGNPDGTKFNLNPRSNPSQAVIQGNALATVINFSANGGALSATAANSGANQAITATGLAATDFVIAAMKPTSQANLGVSQSVIPAANSADVMFATANGAVTATANQQYVITALRGVPIAQANLSPAAVVTKTVSKQQFSVGGNGDVITATVAGGKIVSYAVSNQGDGGFAVTPEIIITPDYANGGTGSGATAKAVVANGYIVSVIPTSYGTGYTANLVNVDATGGSFVSPGSVVCVQKATHQANLVVGAPRIIDNNKVEIPFAAVGAANITPTASEIYKFASLNTVPGMATPIRIQANLANFTAAAANASNSTAVTVVGIAAGDGYISVNPAALQSPVVFSSGFCAANTVTVLYGAGVPGATPSNGVYQLNVMQMAQATPVLVFDVAPTMSACVANSVTKITATLPSNITLQANSAVAWNPTADLGGNLMGLGARANTSTTIDFDIMNVGTGSVTPANQNFRVAAITAPIVTITANQIEGATFTTCGVTLNALLDGHNEVIQTLADAGIIKGY
jgi:hypothetical protein